MPTLKRSNVLIDKAYHRYWFTRVYTPVRGGSKTLLMHIACFCGRLARRHGQLGCVRVDALSRVFTHSLVKQAVVENMIILVGTGAVFCKHALCLA